LKKCFFIISLFSFNAIFACSQNNNIYNILNKEIVIHDNLAGQSFTLIYEDNNYYIYRDIFGSGVPSIGRIKYSVLFNSEYKITFYEIISISENIKDRYNRNEIFEIYYRNELEIYLNGIKISINYIKDN
jgi:hypothetical protein